MRSSTFVGVVLCPCAVLLSARTALAAFTGTSAPYFSSLNSPLVTGSPGFGLENFESGALALPGVSVSSLHGTSVDPGLSVDADDGLIDGSGAAGKSLTVVTQANTMGVTFSFNSIVLGSYPKSVAIVVTAAGVNQLVFQSYDASNNVSGTMTLASVNTFSPTGDDFVLWASDPAGISAISLSSINAAGFTHLDHLQYDTINAIPAPGAMGAVGVAGLLGLSRRRRAAH
jgi:hypothetical protein